MDSARFVQYGTPIRLTHKATGVKLMSLDKPYCHPDSSLQQMVVGTITKEPNTIWWVKTANDAANPVGQPVKNGDIIRLEHVETRKNLHSHGDRKAPIDKTQQEVTAWGENGVGDANDLWRIELADAGDTWAFDTAFRLIHVNTNKALHSHRTTHPIYTNGLQEVTGFSGRDSNDLWVCDWKDQPRAASSFGFDISPSKKWLEWLNVVGSLASITGWTLLTLKQNLEGITWILGISYVFSSAMVLAILLIMTAWIIRQYRFLTFNPRPLIWKVAMGLLVAPFYVLAIIVSWRVSVRFAETLFVPILTWAVG